MVAGLTQLRPGKGQVQCGRSDGPPVHQAAPISSHRPRSSIESPSRSLSIDQRPADTIYCGNCHRFVDFLSTCALTKAVNMSYDQLSNLESGRQGGGYTDDPDFQSLQHDLKEQAAKAAHQQSQGLPRCRRAGHKEGHASPARARTPEHGGNPGTVQGDWRGSEAPTDMGRPYGL